MLAALSGWEQVGLGAAVIVLATLIISVGQAAGGLVRTRQTNARNQKSDTQKIVEFLFDTPGDPRTRTPPRQGWTTKVDNTLSSLTSGQRRQENLANAILSELKEDGNGDHNLRGIIKRTAEAAGADLPPRDERDKT